MAKTFTTGLVITGDAGGGVRAIKSTQSELKRLNQDFNRGGQQSRKYAQDIKHSNSELTSLTNTLRPLAGIMAGVFAASTLKGQIDFADSLHKMNLRLGISTEALSEYNYVAAGAGVEFNTLATAWQRQTRRIAEAAQGTGVAVKALDTLGLSAKELNQLKPEDQFERIAAALEGIENPGQKASLAMKLWDTEGVKLLQITNQGTAAMAQMRQEAVDLGQSISHEAATSMADFNDSLARVQALASGTTDTLLAELIPGITQTVNGFTDFVKGAGGAAVVADKLTTGAGVLATIYAGRLVGSIGAKTAATVKGVAAEYAARLETAQRTAQDKIAEAQTTRRTVAEQTAAANTARMAAQRTQLAQAEAAEKLRSIQQTQQQMAAERLLETQRLQAQISATGRQQSLTRLAVIRQQETALVGQQTLAERTLTQATVANTSATRIQNITKLELARSTKIADAAMISSTVSTRAATTAQLAMASATSTLSKGMALLGGPLGLAFLAGSALLMFATSADSAKLSADDLAASIETASEKLQQMTNNQLLANRLKIEDLLISLDRQIGDTSARMETLKVNMASTPGSRLVGEWMREQIELGGVLDTNKGKAEEFKEKLREINRYLNGERPEPVKLPPAASAPKAGKAGKASKTDNTAQLRGQAQKYLQELERINDTEVQKVERWRQDSLAQADSFFNQSLLKREEYEFAQVAVAEEAARRLQAIEDRGLKKTNDEASTIVSSLRTEEEAITESYARRREIILAATNLTEQERTQAMQRLEQERSDSLMEVNGSYWERYMSAAEKSLTNFDELAGNMIENFSSSSGSAFESMVFDAENLDDAIQGLAQGMARAMVNSLGQIAAQWATTHALKMVGIGAETTAVVAAETTKATASVAATTVAASASVAATATTTTAQVAAAGTTAAAWLPAALVASIGSFGAAAVIGGTALLAAYALIGGFKEGGYTGDIAENEIAGVVHGKEFVMNAAATRRIGVDNLNKMASGGAMGPVGGGTGSAGAASGGRSQTKITVNLIEDRSKAGQVEQQENDDGSTDINAFIADIYGEGERSSVLESVYGLQRVGR